MKKWQKKFLYLFSACIMILCIFFIYKQEKVVVIGTFSSKVNQIENYLNAHITGFRTQVID